MLIRCRHRWAGDVAYRQTRPSSSTAGGWRSVCGHRPSSQQASSSHGAVSVFRALRDARTHACAFVDDSGHVVGEHEWEEEMLEETGGDFLLIHVRFQFPQSTTSTNDRDSCLCKNPLSSPDSTPISEESSQSPQ